MIDPGWPAQGDRFFETDSPDSEIIFIDEPGDTTIRPHPPNVPLEWPYRPPSSDADSAWVKELLMKREDERRREDVLEVLAARFGSLPDEIGTRLRSVTDPSRILELIRWAACCPTLESFRARI